MFLIHRFCNSDTICNQLPGRETWPQGEDAGAPGTRGCTLLTFPEIQANLARHLLARASPNDSDQDLPTWVKILWLYTTPPHGHAYTHVHTRHILMCTCKHTYVIMHTFVHTYAHRPVKTHSHMYTRAEKQRWSACDMKCFVVVSPESDSSMHPSPFPS